ncbi:MAG TPA: FG-GAP-like repeat-containing protein, partial [Urbifossiella sp.]|nr:FG-GAP-like repeat-containing protein [Urbifossiella sp.]
TETGTPGTYTAVFTGAVAGSPSSLTVTVSGVQLSTQPAVSVTSGPVSGSSTTAVFATPSVLTGVTDVLTVVVRDGAGNPITGLQPGTFSFSTATGSSTYTIGSLTETSTPGTYTAPFTGLTAGTTDTLTVHVSGVLLTAQPAIQVTSPPVVPPPPPPPAGHSPGLVGSANFAVGADAGGSAVVTTYGPGGAAIATATPFPGATGGVRTAVGDFNGDGTPDLAVGTGPGAVAEVKVLDGKTGAVLFDVQPFANFTGGVFVTAGDITGDGTADLVVTPDLSGGPRVEVYRGGDFALVANFFGIDDPNFRGGVRAGVGDLTGDGHADIVVSAGFGGGPRISVYDGAALLQGQLVHPVADFFAFEPTLRNGAYVAVGDVNGDGIDDLVFGAGPGGGPRVLVVSGATVMSAGPAAAIDTPVANFFAGDVNNRGGVRVAVKDLDGDRFADVMTGAGPGGGSGVSAYLGTALTAGAATADLAFDAFPGFTGGVFVG